MIFEPFAVMCGIKARRLSEARLGSDWEFIQDFCRASFVRHASRSTFGELEPKLYVTMAVDVRQLSLFHRKVGKSKYSKEMLNSSSQLLPCALPQKKKKKN